MSFSISITDVRLRLAQLWKVPANELADFALDFRAKPFAIFVSFRSHDRHDGSPLKSPRLKQLSVRRHSGEIMASPVIIAARPQRGSTRPVDGEREIG